MKQHKIISDIGVKKIGIIGGSFVLTNYILSILFKYSSTLVLVFVVLVFLFVLNINALKRPELNWIERMETTRKSLIIENIAYATGIVAVALLLYKSIWP